MSHAAEGGAVAAAGHEASSSCSPNVYRMIDFIRAAKNGMYAISNIQIGGYQIDNGLHLAVGFCLVVLFSRVVSLRKSVSATLGLILFKEVFDLFGKPDFYRIRPLHMDVFYDLTLGILGVLVAYWLLRKMRARATDSTSPV
jgi:hypothetical protein